MPHLKNLEAVIFDWSGTLVDHGSLAPVAVFADVFNEYGIKLNARQIRSSMGLSKREHIGAILTLPEVAAAWETAHGHPPDKSTIEQLYREFLEQQESVIVERAKLLKGVIEVMEELRSEGIRIGTTTGYPREAASALEKEVHKVGFDPDCIVCASDVPKGRPAPWMIFHACEKLGIFPMSKVVKVDDTISGVQAGRNAGCWSIGVSMTGNLVGLSQFEFRDLKEEDKIKVCRHAEEELFKAGAHYVIRSVAEILPVLVEIDQRLGMRDIDSYSYPVESAL